MKFNTKLKKSSLPSFFIYIPIKIINDLSLKERDDIEVDINLIKLSKTLKCKKCLHEFDTDERLEEVYCPACECCDFDIINDEVKK